MTESGPIPRMPVRFGLGFAAFVCLLAGANALVTGDAKNFTDAGYVFGFLIATGLIGYCIGWVAWRFGAHKRFHR